MKRLLWLLPMLLFLCGCSVFAANSPHTEPVQPAVVEMSPPVVISDHLPLRALLLTAANTIRGELLHGQTANVIDGRDGWLFFADEAKDYMGTNALTDEQLRAMAVTLRLIQERTEQGGG